MPKVENALQIENIRVIDDQDANRLYAIVSLKDNLSPKIKDNLYCYTFKF
mgnify:CR=1 FL=1